MPWDGLLIYHGDRILTPLTVQKGKVTLSKKDNTFSLLKNFMKCNNIFFFSLYTGGRARLSLLPECLLAFTSAPSN